MNEKLPSQSKTTGIEDKSKPQEAEIKFQIPHFFSMNQLLQTQIDSQIKNLTLVKQQLEKLENQLQNLENVDAGNVSPEDSDTSQDDDISQDQDMMNFLRQKMIELFTSQKENPSETEESDHKNNAPHESNDGKEDENSMRTGFNI